MSQFCGSRAVFISRCGATSAATAGMATVARLIDDTAASNVLRGMSSLRIRSDCSEFSYCACVGTRMRLRWKMRDADCAVLTPIARTPQLLAPVYCATHLSGDAASLARLGPDPQSRTGSAGLHLSRTQCGVLDTI